MFSDVNEIYALDPSSMSLIRPIDFGRIDDGQPANLIAGVSVHRELHDSTVKIGSLR
jgi:hypothetical protein